MGQIKLNFKILTQEQYLIPFKMILVYLSWRVFHHFASIPGGVLNHFWVNIVYEVGCAYASITSVCLSIFGMKASASGININLINSNKQIWVMEYCLAIPALIIFTGTVAVFKGNLKDKILFWAVGSTGIILINTIRLMCLCLAWVYLSSFYFRIHHSIIHIVIMYALIFLMVAWWINHSVAKDDKRLG